MRASSCERARQTSEVDLRVVQVRASGSVEGIKRSLWRCLEARTTSSRSRSNATAEGARRSGLAVLENASDAEEDSDARLRRVNRARTLFIARCLPSRSTRHTISLRKACPRRALDRRAATASARSPARRGDRSLHAPAAAMVLFRFGDFDWLCSTAPQSVCSLYVRQASRRTSDTR